MRKSIIIYFLFLFNSFLLLAQNEVHTINIEGKERIYSLTVPSVHDSLMPMVITLHGYDNMVKNIGKYTEMDNMAKKAGFIAVYPEGTKNINGYYTWNAGKKYEEWTHNAKDVVFIDSLINYLVKNYPIDSSRIYVAGHDNGSMMAYRLAAELSGKIAAIACISGQMVDTLSVPSHPVAIMHVHGDNDIILPHTGTEQYGFQVASIDEIIKKWLDWNSCSTVPSILKYDPKVTALQWDGKADVRLYLLHNMGHDWPTLERGNWPATEFIWDFFKEIRK